MDTSKVWYITGASQGFGLILVNKLLENGYHVAATSRKTEVLKKAVGETDAQRFLPLSVDLGDPSSIVRSVEQTVARFGRIDVLVNNAGYGMTGTVEEISEPEIRKIFDVNVIAAIEVVKSVLPTMRKQRSGYIINMGSVAGFVGAPGWSVYSATKAALAAFTEVLALDVKEFGIQATVVEPSGFRTGFLTKDSLAYTESRIEGYQEVKETQKRYLAADGKQPGDPKRATAILIELAESEQPPLHLYLGEDAYHRVSEKLTVMGSELEEWKFTSISADYK